MDTAGFIQAHTKAKLELYSQYLRRYLAVLMYADFFKEICIFDIFAGRGRSLNGEKGSAIIAAEVIQDSLENTKSKSKKNVTLYLNDADSESTEHLSENTKIFSFVKISNKSANDFIGSLVSKTGCHNFFFIDPYGYSQVSKEYLSKVFQLTPADFLIFVPIYHIYRFLRKEESIEQLKPIACFLNTIGISEETARHAKNVEDFSEMVRNALVRMSHKRFVYKQLLKNQSINSMYCLFFIAGNILGAEKFLEAQEKLKIFIEDQKEKASTQLSFQLEPPPVKYAKLVEKLLTGGPYDNLQLYELGILAGLLPTQLRAELSQMEKAGIIEVIELEGIKREQKGFYLHYKYFKRKEKRISVRLLQQDLL